MTPCLSIYLDLFRFSAAMLVFLSHLSYIPYSGGRIDWIYEYGHVAVMAFFVLSGYVIAFTTDKKHTAMGDYMVARLARLYSVVLPAIVFTPILDNIGETFSTSVYEKIPDSHPALRVLMTSLFMQESWSASLSYFSNTPLWSVAYEFWYYFIFGVITFASGWRRYIGLVGAALLIGPRIIILLPIWCFGVLVYRIHANTNYHIGMVTSGIIFVSSLSIIVFLTSHPLGNALKHQLHIMRYFPEANEFLTWSRFFIYDYLIGGLFFLHILSAKYVIKGVGEIGLIKARPIIRFLAGVTFSIYLYHLPLMYFFKAAISYDAGLLQNGILVGIAVFLLCIALAMVTEHNKGFYYKNLKRVYLFAKAKAY